MSISFIGLSDAHKYDIIWTENKNLIDSLLQENMNRQNDGECPLAVTPQHQWGLISVMAQAKGLRRRLDEEGADIYNFESRNLDDWSPDRDRTDEEKEEQQWVRQATRERKELVGRLNKRRMKALRRSGWTLCKCPLGNLIEGQLHFLEDILARIGMSMQDIWEDEWSAEQ